MTTEITVGIVAALIALALVVVPLFRKPTAVRFGSDGEIRQEIERYRAAIKARTLCERCLSANPARSNFCRECGRSL